MVPNVGPEDAFPEGFDPKAQMLGACPSCKAKLAPGAKFCASCGNKIGGAAKSFCTGCGEQLQPGGKFCPSCGANVTQSLVNPETKERVLLVCPKCQMRVVSGVNFCPQCGEYLSIR